MIKRAKDPFSILLVVDDVKRRNNLSSRLRSQNCSVEASTGGFHSMTLLEEKPEYYQMVLLIGHMKDMNAYEQISLIRSTYEKNDLKILYIYNPKEIDDSASLLEAGADNLLEDNNRFDTIMNVIENHRR